MSSKGSRSKSRSPDRKSGSSAKTGSRKPSGLGSRTKTGTSTRTKSGRSSKTNKEGRSTSGIRSRDTRSGVERDNSRLSPGRQSTYSSTMMGDDREQTDLGLDERIPSPDLMALQNSAVNPRLMRRIIAEDDEWTLATVSPLANICLDNIVKTFEVNSSVLNKLPAKDRALVLERIPTTLPLRVTARLVDDDNYWKKCCLERWSVCDVMQHGGRWKRMFFEKNLQDLIERYVPGITDPMVLQDTVLLSSNYVRCLDIRQLLPPVRPVVARRANRKRPGADSDIPSEFLLEDLNVDSASDAGQDEFEPLTEHFDFNTVLPQLPFLEDFRVRYGVRNCGMNFDWRLFLFTSRDCELLSRCIASCRTLRKLTIHQSKVDDDKVRNLIKHIIDHPVLHDLDLSHNLISDRGARAVGKFINNRSQLTYLNLANNRIATSGALALAHALTKNTTLIHLDLQLNQVGDEGGQAICRALIKNSTLQELNLAGNDLSEPTAAALAKLLHENKSLRKLNLSCNKFGHDGGEYLKSSMSANVTVTFMDLRLTDCSHDTELYIQQRIARNQDITTSA